MKKVLFMAVAAAAISFASCTNAAKGDANPADSTATPAVEAVEELTNDLQSKLDAKDAAGLQTALATINEKIEALKSEGKLEEAKSLVKKVQDFLTNNAETVKGVVGENETLNKLVDGVKAIPVDALGAGEEAVDAAKEGVKDAANAAQDKAEAAVDAAKEKANEAVDAAKEKAAEKVNEAAEKAASKAVKGLGL